jgi:putative glutamine amidotransferase
MIVSILVILPGTWGCKWANPRVSGRPLIGITTAYSEKNNTNAVNLKYVDAVQRNGGIPVLLPTIDDEEAVQRYVEELDGLVLIGGRDVPPALYGQKPHETVKLIHPRRVSFDRALIARWMATEKPILGICLGMQFVNVVMGGTLIQDIPSQIGAKVIHRETYHRVTIEPDSALAELLRSETAMVYSNHHQAVDGLGAGLRAVARADDGVVEALERTDGGAGLFLQWHPEFMVDKYPDHTNAIYGYLVDLCVHGR